MDFLTRHKDKQPFPLKKSGIDSSSIQGNVSPTLHATAGNDLFSRVEKASNEVVKELDTGLDKIVEGVGLQTEYGKKELKENLQWIIKELDRMSIPNEDWNWHAKTSRSAHEFKHIIMRTLEAATYEVEKDWGYAEITRNKPKDKAEEIADALWEPMERWKDEFLAQFPQDVRASEYAKSKKAVRTFIALYMHRMQRKVTELR